MRGCLTFKCILEPKKRTLQSPGVTQCSHSVLISRSEDPCDERETLKKQAEVMHGGSIACMHVCVYELMLGGGGDNSVWLLCVGELWAAYRLLAWRGPHVPMRPWRSLWRFIFLPNITHENFTFSVLYLSAFHLKYHKDYSRELWFPSNMDLIHGMGSLKNHKTPTRWDFITHPLCTSFPNSPWGTWKTY